MDAPVALVTGASAGFGLLTTIELARRGARVVPTMRDRARRGALDEAAGAAGVSTEPLVDLDVTDAASIRAAAERVRGDYGRLDILVNNAGYSCVGPMEAIAAAQLRRQIETSVVGVAEVTKAFLPLMRARGRGRVVVVSSMAGRVAVPLMAPYNAAKFAVEGLVEAWSYELRPFGVDFSLIEPGTFRTEFPDRQDWADAREGPYADMARVTAEKTALRYRMGGDPARVARLIARVSLQRRRPRLRYAAGVDAHVGLVAQALLPGGLFRWSAARAAGLPREA